MIESGETASRHSPSDLRVLDPEPYDEEQERAQEEEEVQEKEDNPEVSQSPGKRASESREKEPEVAGHRPKGIIKRTLLKIKSFITKHRKLKLKKPNLNRSVREDN